MPNWDLSDSLKIAPAEVIAGYVGSRKSEMLDAVITAAALVAQADRWVDRAERHQLIDFLERKRLLPVTRFDVRDAFERRVRELREPGGIVTALDRLGRGNGRALAEFALEAAHEIAAADDQLDPREIRALNLLQATLRP